MEKIEVKLSLFADDTTITKKQDTKSAYKNQ
jgi:hypothetical protein